MELFSSDEPAADVAEQLSIEHVEIPVELHEVAVVGFLHAELVAGRVAADEGPDGDEGEAERGGVDDAERPERVGVDDGERAEDVEPVPGDSVQDGPFPRPAGCGGAVPSGRITEAERTEGERAAEDGIAEV